MARILLTQQKVALVDDDDVQMLAGFHWVAVKSHSLNFQRWYVQAYNTTAKKNVYMHRLLMQARKGEQVDHRNHDGLDNQRDNLRLCSQSENNGNARWKPGASGYRGVVWHQGNKSWQARISLKNKKKTIGYAKCPIEAARLYDAFARSVHGEFATLNFQDA